MAEDQYRTIQKVSCVCGATIRVDPKSNARQVRCPSCDSTFDFVVSMDAAHKRSKVSIVLSRAAMKTEGESLGAASGKPRPETPAAPPPKAPPPAKAAPKVTRAPRKSSGKTSNAIMGNCECGAAFPLEETDDLTSLQSCPQCNCLYHVVFKIESGTHVKSAMLVPEKPKLPKSRTIAQKPAAAPKATTNPDDLRVTDFFTPARKSRAKAPNTRAKKLKPPPEIPPGAQGVPCPCGEIFIVRRKDLAGEMTCETCGKTSTFEETRDPQSLAPVIRIRNS